MAKVVITSPYQSVPIRDNWDGSEHRYADQVYEREHYKESLLLGPDGHPLRYAPRQKLGFDLTPRRGRK